MKWEDMCKPLKAGGCGVKKIDQQNCAFLMKLGFALRARPDALWVQVLRHKYRWDTYKGLIRRNQGCSYLWRHLKQMWQDVDMGSRWDLGDGNGVRFWSDN